MMKKLLITAVFVLATFFASNAQNYAEYQITNITNGEVVFLCDNEFDGAIIYGRTECEQNEWYVNSQYLIANQVTLSRFESTSFTVSHSACGYVTQFDVEFVSSEINNPFTAPIIWKRPNEIITLTAGTQSQYEYLWSNGATSPAIQVTQPGIYHVTLTSIFGCGSETFSIEVRDNVELYRATVDLETNLNKTTWQTTLEQSEYISEVKVYRDGLLVGTAPYQDGYFLDAIGSDNAARNYRLVGVTTEGEECPLASYEKGTIHTTYYEDVNSNLNMTWNIPYVEEGAQGTLTYFQICKYDPNTGELTVVDQVNASITDYTCGVNQFEGGYAVIAAVFNDGKGVEELSFSNLTTEILGIEEDGPSTGSGAFTVYPNPAKDRLTIEGNGLAIITNALGQTIMTKEIDGKETVELPQGLYFVKMNGVTRKIMVE